MSIISDDYEQSLYDEAEDSADEFHKEKAFCLEDILADQAKIDVGRINKGETISKSTAFIHNYLKNITENPLLYCYHAGQKFWQFYCGLIRKDLSDDRKKIAIFPEW